MLHLNHNIWIQIFVFCTRLEDIKNIRLVCKYFNKLIYSNEYINFLPKKLKYILFKYACCSNNIIIIEKLLNFNNSKLFELSFLRIFSGMCNNKQYNLIKFLLNKFDGIDYMRENIHNICDNSLDDRIFELLCIYDCNFYVDPELLYNLMFICIQNRNLNKINILLKYGLIYNNNIINYNKIFKYILLNSNLQGGRWSEGNFHGGSWCKHLFEYTKTILKIFLEDIRFDPSYNNNELLENQLNILWYSKEMNKFKEEIIKLLLKNNCSNKLLKNYINSKNQIDYPINSIKILINNGYNIPYEKINHNPKICSADLWDIDRIQYVKNMCYQICKYIFVIIHIFLSIYLQLSPIFTNN